MADQEQETPTLPSAEKPAKRTHATLDEREAALDARELELAEQSANMNPAGFEAHPARTTTDEGAQTENAGNPKGIRATMGHTYRLDIQDYQQIHKDKQLLWVNDLNGDVQRWIDIGAEPVPVANRTGKTFEGITDKAESKWKRSMGGSDGEGNYFWVYLLMIAPERYHEVQIAPQLERQDLIRRAMKAGGDQSEVGPGGPRLPTYAPNLPTGDRGYDEQHETVAQPLA